MAETHSEILDGSPYDEKIDSETSTSYPLYDNTGQRDEELRAIIEESAFQILAKRFLIKRPPYTLCASDPDEDTNFFSMPFPKKLWEIVGSDKFKSIWWDEDGTSIVINEELFKKEVLERKAPFRIFETNSMKSFVRQLNRYGFKKIRQSFQQSASLPDFLAEENGISSLHKLQFYHNPNFLRDSPHLIEKIKRRIRIKTAARGTASLVPDFKNKQFSSELGSMTNYGLSAAVQTNEISQNSSSTMSNVYLRQKPFIIQGHSDTMDVIRSDFPFTPSNVYIVPPKENLTHSYAQLHGVSALQTSSQTIYIPANNNNMQFTTISTTPNQVWNDYFKMQSVAYPFQAWNPYFASSSFTLSASKPIGEPKSPVYKDMVASTDMTSASNCHASL